MIDVCMISDCMESCLMVSNFLVNVYFFVFKGLVRVDKNLGMFDINLGIFDINLGIFDIVTKSLFIF